MRNPRSGEFFFIRLDHFSWAIVSFRVSNLKCLFFWSKSKHSYPTKFFQKQTNKQKKQGCYHLLSNHNSRNRSVRASALFTRPVLALWEGTEVTHNSTKYLKCSRTLSYRLVLVKKYFSFLCFYQVCNNITMLYFFSLQNNLYVSWSTSSVH